MAVTMEQIKELRAQTGAGVLDVKKALEQADGDMERAAEILREKGLLAAAKKADRQAAEGRVEVYVHPGNKLVGIVILNCETDFVARTEAFIELAHDLAMQVAALAPRWVSREDVPADVIAAEKATFADDIAGKPANIAERIVQGKLDKFYQQYCLLDQAFIKDDSKTVQSLIQEAIARIGENILVSRIERLSIDSAA
ncbi:MAG: translation elongation factor Ts [Anaerolineae bacterium]|jgi:elongation factor Ts|nr:translation elongation factor Ts [Chloroflexota bacterium]